MRNKLIILIQLLGLLFGGFSAQAYDQGKKKFASHLKPTKPLIYTTVEKRGPREPVHGDDSLEGTWLRIHNNSIWSISIPTYGVVNSQGEAGVYYEVISDSCLEIPRIDSSNPCKHFYVQASDYVDYQSIRPGKSILFSIPDNHIQKGMAIRVPIQFEWELDNDEAVQHFLVIRGDQLAKE